MKRFFHVFAGIAFFCAFVCALDASAQKPPPPKPLSIGVLNGKATKLPAPVYPPTARAVKAEGVVNVQIQIDEKGKVLSAKAVSGHPLLRSSAERAALLAEFEPALLEGKAVRIAGIVVYNFKLSTTTPIEKIGAPLEAPDPEYPEKALNLKVSGMVTVLVTFNEKGEVISAEATSGHPLLREASEMAALRAKFKPVAQDGQPTKITTVLTYEFIAGVGAQYVKKQD